MNAIIKAWVEALESGEYPQGRRTMEVAGKFCCLGVLCRIYDRMKPGELEITRRLDGVIKFDGSAGTLPQKIASAIHIDTFGTLAKIVEFDGLICRTLVRLNDAGMPFSEIAQVIRSGGVVGINKEQEST